MKVRFYLGTFVAYFITCFVLIKLIDISRIGKATTKQLHESAHASNVYIPQLSHQELHDYWFSVKCNKKARKMVFNKLMGKDYVISKIMQKEAQFKSITDGRSEASAKFTKTNRLGRDSGYSEGFYSYLEQRRTYLGCEPLLYAAGNVKMCCWCWNWAFIQGTIEDLVIFLCNNHSLLNCFYACDNAGVDHTGNCLIYTTQQCIAFFMSAISGSALNYFQLPDAANVVFDVLVTTPSTIAMAKILKTLYVCPVCFSVEYQATHSRTVWILKILGKTAILPIIAATAVLLVAAAVFSRGHNTVHILFYFFLQVQLYGFFLELIFSSLMFVSNFYMRSTIDLHYRSIVLLEIGRRFTEIIHFENLIENKDYHYRCYYICCFLRIECVYKFEDAVKKGYVKEEDRIMDDVEMTESSDRKPSVSLQYSIYKQASFLTSNSMKSIMRNPMQSSATTNPMNAGTVIYNENEERESEFISYNYNEAQSPAPTVTVNPMYAASTHKINTQRFGREIATVEDEYDTTTAEKMSVRTDEQYYPEPTSDDTLTADDDLILRRRNFKEGTRNSFIKVFRKFEEEDQLKSIHTSVERTNDMQNIFNKNKGNILARHK